MSLTKKRTQKNSAAHENTPTLEQVQSLCEQLDPRDRYQICIFLCARLGLRRGESMGLCWNCVDFKNRTLHVRQALKDDGIIGPPKTASSVRAITLTDSVIDALKARKAQQRADFEQAVRAKLIPEMPDMNKLLVIADPASEVTRVQSLDCWWKRHREKYGLKCTIHELRHAFVTYMICDLNIPVATVQACCGHKTPTITLQVYANAHPGMVAGAMNAAESAFAGSEL